MKDENIQLIQHSDLANRQIGCWLAWHDGYGTEDIFELLLSTVYEVQSKITTQYRVGNYILQVIQIIPIRRRWGNTYNFLILEQNEEELLILNKVYSIQHSEYKKVLKHYKQMFIEYILNEET